MSSILILGSVAPVFAQSLGPILLVDSGPASRSAACDCAICDCEDCTCAGQTLEARSTAAVDLSPFVETSPVVYSTSVPTVSGWIEERSCVNGVCTVTRRPLTAADVGPVATSGGPIARAAACANGSCGVLRAAPRSNSSQRWRLFGRWRR